MGSALAYIIKNVASACCCLNPLKNEVVNDTTARTLYEYPEAYTELVATVLDLAPHHPASSDRTTNNSGALFDCCRLLVQMAGFESPSLHQIRKPWNHFGSRAFSYPGAITGAVRNQLLRAISLLQRGIVVQQKDFCIMPQEGKFHSFVSQ
jgi:hypothetical protein